MDPSAPARDPKTTELDNPLHAIGFRIETLSPQLVSGRLTVTPICCQPFGMLHGGISALIAEALASLGAQMPPGSKRVPGIHLSINHIKAAQIGDSVLAEAIPVSVGRTIQLWEVGFWKIDLSNGNAKEDPMASSRVTIICNLPVPKHAEKFAMVLKKHAKL